MTITSSEQFYTGGLAEIADHPSDLTLSYLQSWFRTNSALGRAFTLLHMPFNSTTSPVLKRIDGELVVDLLVEEQILYKNTLLKYAKQKSRQDAPKLILDVKKILNPLCWFGTFKQIYTQSYWLGKSDELYANLEALVKALPVYETTDKKVIEQTLAEKVIPVVTAVGIINEFYYHLIKMENKAAAEHITLYIDSQIKATDWFYASMNEQLNVQNGKLSLSNYLKKYGIRADNDYELSCPRWHEQPEVIKQRISNYRKYISSRITPTLPSMSVAKLKHIDTYIKLMLLRSEVKKISLLWLDLLRTNLLSTNSISGYKSAKNDQLLKIDNIANKAATPPVELRSQKHKGLPISPGIAKGVAKIVNNANETVTAEEICIFPNSSTTYSNLFPKCNGIIFLRGGQTSHGAIVAREFGIPAITDKNAEILTDGQSIVIDGSSGEWHFYSK